MADYREGTGEQLPGVRDLAGGVEGSRINEGSVGFDFGKPDSSEGTSQEIPRNIPEGSAALRENGRRKVGILPSVLAEAAESPAAPEVSEPEVQEPVEARHAAEPSEPDDSGEQSGAAEHEARHAEAEENEGAPEPGDAGSDVPPTDPPETAQAGEFGDDDEGGDPDDSDPLVRDMRDAALESGIESILDNPPADLREGTGQDTGEQRKLRIPGQRKGPEGAQPTEGTETDAPPDQADTTDAPGTPPSTEEIDAALRNILGDRLRNAELGTTDQTSETDETDGIPDNDINAAMGDVAELLSDEGPRDPDFRSEASFDNDERDETHEEADATEFNAQPGEGDDPRSWVTDEALAKFLGEENTSGDTRESSDEQESRADLPGPQGLESQLGNLAHEEGYTSDEADVYDDPNSTGVPTPAEMAGTEETPESELPRRERSDIGEDPGEGYVAPPVDPETLRRIADHLRDDSGTQPSSPDSEQGNNGDTPPEGEGPKNPEAG